MELKKIKLSFLLIIFLSMLTLVACDKNIDSNSTNSSSSISSKSSSYDIFSTQEMDETETKNEILEELSILAEKEMDFWDLVFPKNKIEGVYLRGYHDDDLDVDIFEFETDEGVFKLIESRGLLNFGVPAYFYAPWSGAELIIFYHGELSMEDASTSKSQYTLIINDKLGQSSYQENIDCLSYFFNNDPNIAVKNYIEAMKIVIKESGISVINTRVIINPYGFVYLENSVGHRVRCLNYRVKDGSLYYEIDVIGIADSNRYYVDIYTGEIKNQI